jgi:phosphoribosylformylglycinamidine cyclo-ligase
MVAVVRPEDATGIIEALEATGETVFSIGEIQSGTKGCTVRGAAETWSAREPWSATHHG